MSPENTHDISYAALYPFELGMPRLKSWIPSNGRYESSLQEERSQTDTDRFSLTSSIRLPRGPPKRVRSENVILLLSRLSNDPN